MLAAFRQRSLTATEAAEQLGVTGSRLYTLSTDYLRACARTVSYTHLIPRKNADNNVAATQFIKGFTLACQRPQGEL